jgi:purine-nucleoside phosphorylase
MNNIFQAVEETTNYLRARLDFKPGAAIILGTGLGGLAERIEVSQVIPYEEVPHFAPSTVESHRGRLVCGTLSGINVVAMQGRLHYYEGYSLQQVTLPVRVLRKLGIGVLVINSAAGGLNPDFKAGDVMAITDHINFPGHSPLRGTNEPELGDRFPDMTRPYDDELIELPDGAAAELSIPLRHGVYAWVEGPNLETPAETRMLRTLGADAVGMSTVPEVIVATQVKFRTIALAAITNINLPDAMEPISVEKVIANAEKAEPRLAALVQLMLKSIKGI